MLDVIFLEAPNLLIPFGIVLVILFLFGRHLISVKLFKIAPHKIAFKSFVESLAMSFFYLVISFATMQYLSYTRGYSLHSGDYETFFYFLVPFTLSASLVFIFVFYSLNKRQIIKRTIEGTQDTQEQIVQVRQTDRKNFLFLPKIFFISSIVLGSIIYFLNKVSSGDLFGGIVILPLWLLTILSIDAFIVTLLASYFKYKNPNSTHKYKFLYMILFIILPFIIVFILRGT